MTASTSALTGTLTAQRPGAGLFDVSGQIRSLARSLSQTSSLQRGLAISIVAAAVLTLVGLTQGRQAMGYLTVFGLSVLFNAILFVPTGRGAVMLGAAMVLDPLTVAVLSGVGGALGEITGYMVGRSSNSFIKTGRLGASVERIAERRMALTILAISIIPNPLVDFIGIIAGRLRYPFGLFLTYSIIGKVVQCTAIVFIVRWNLALFGSLLGLG